jgi:DNA gyrase subunit A
MRRKKIMAKQPEENTNEEDNKKEIQKGLVEEEKAADVMDDKSYEAEVLEKEAINLKDLDENRQIGAEISTEMKRSYIDYAMSVIVSRALPSAEDGLKPVHRRILYAMKLMGLEKGMTKKCARIVGDTMGKFHPHGDMAIYDALVRMAQDFSLRYPLVHGQGNFGSMDGDNAAASRYTEAKLDKMAVELLADIDKDTVKWTPNFDNSVDEPIILPGKVPNLLINGSSGIAVGMTTNIPPHNLIEVCDAISATIDKPAITTDELMEIIKGPDFPTGGVIVAENLKALYDGGRGGFVVRGRVTTEEGEKDRDSIIITEIPYQVNKSELVKQIAALISDKKLPDVSDIRDESSKGKVRIVIELKKGADSKFTINRLYKSTNLQTKFDAVMIALVNGVPQLMALKQMLQVYIDYRRKVIRNRTKFELKEAEDREHIVQGLLICLKNIDEIVAVIKKSREEVAETLMKKFGLSKKQADAILEMKLRQLTALEHDKLKKEEDELMTKIKELREILGDEKLILKLIKKDLSELKKEFGDERRSKLINKIAEFAEKDLVKKEDVIVSITDKGYIKRMPYKAYREQKRGGKGVIGADLSTGDFVKQVISCSTHDYLLLFTQRGRVFWLKAYQVPETQRYGRGQALINLLSLKEDNVSSVISVKEFKNGFLFLATKLGIVKKMKLEMFANPRNTGVRAINLPLDNSDTLIEVSVINPGQEVMMTTAEGQAIRFNSDEVRDMGRASYGVTGIKLEKGDEVVSQVVVTNPKNETVLTVTKDGYGKRSIVDDYRLTGRACKGVINLKITGKNGKVIRTINVVDSDQIIVSTEKGIMIKTPVKDIRVMGRATQGVRVIRLQDNDKVVDVASLSKEEDDSEPATTEEKK